MLRQRITTAIILLLIIVMVLFKTPTMLFAVVCWGICIFAIYELTRMYQFKPLETLAVLILNTAIVIAINQLNYDFSQIIRISTIITWCFIVPMILIFMPQNFSKMMITMFSILLFIPAYYALVAINTVFGPSQLISIMAIAWVADSGAYFVGRQFGRRKIAPRISPGKSVEGAIGGGILVIAYLILLQHYNLAKYLSSPTSAIKFAIILTIISIMGDLFESWLKRVAKVKDSGCILPGHGGIFDRIDSLIGVLAIGFTLIWVP